MRFIFLALLVNISAAWGQQPVPDTSSKSATVNVTVTDMKARPRKGEEVLFRGEKSGKIINGITDANGKFSQQLPPGDNYHVSVKSISDTTNYLVLQVPALQEDEFFTDPFWVNVKMDPPRQYRLDKVYFDVDKASLRPESYKQLGELLEYLQRHDDIRIEIAGHTDNTGTTARNNQLSQERANAIRSYLLGKGIKAIRVQAKGYGDSQPVADNNTADGRQLNRRTEVIIL